jgi:DNA-binding GntR family transcriptional regulator
VENEMMTTEPRDRAKPLALKDWAYQVLKEDILSLKLPPGTVVRIGALTEELDVSRTPVREALLTLENEGLVRSEPRVGFFVAEISRRDLEELYELRAVLEGYAVQTAAPYVTDEDLSRLENGIETSQTAVEHGELDRFLEIDTAFHALLIERAPNSRLMVMMDSIGDLTHRLHYLGLKCVENIHESLVEHKEILGALRRRDSQLAARLMSDHLHAVKDRLLRCVDLSGESPEPGPGA